MRVLLVDDHLLFIEGLRLYLMHLDPEARCALATSAEQGLQLAGQESFELVLLDWNLKGLAQAQAVQRFRECVPDARVIVMSGEASAKAVREAVDAGAVGFIPKEQRGEDLEQALRTVAQGGVYLPPALMVATGREPAAPQQDRQIAQAFPQLTPRQQEVFRVMLRGQTNKQIARELGISDNTVKSHMDVIFREIGVNTRTEAVYLAARQGVRIA